MRDKELTREELDQQDNVDSAINYMINELVDLGINKGSSDIEWDIYYISKIRDIVIEYMRLYYSDQFNEERFYPSIKGES